ncbi:MAG: galactose oxidase [Actinomycetota bacterium]|nr:galactose oxidase [Actinomycetota bacterium]MDQ1641155.1 galactose oxidase [Actinomycetota bacterium]
MVNIFRGRYGSRALVGVLCLGFLGLLTGSSAGAVTTDSWSTSVTLRTPDGWYASPIHGSLLPDGRIFLWGVARSAWPVTAGTTGRRTGFMVTASAIDGAGANLTVQPTAEPVEIDSSVQGSNIVQDDFVCAGQNLTADGKLFTAGGTRAWVDSATGAAQTVIGLHYESSLDPTTNTWSRLPGAMVAMSTLSVAARWYPTVTRLPDGRMLITSGFERVSPSPSVNLSTETYDPATGIRTVASPLGTVPTAILNRDYTHAFVLPYASAPKDVLMIGESGQPVMTSTRNLSSWSSPSPARPGTMSPHDGVGQSTAMLPIRVINREFGYGNGSILVAGGAHGSMLMSQADVFDPTLNTWRTSTQTSVMRHHPATVALPDGRMLILAGHNMVGDLGVLHAQYIDPYKGFSVTDGSAAMAEMRGYHTVALLLPDGRVLLAGGRDADTSTSSEKPSLQIYSPDYMGKPRPSINSAPTAVGYRGLFAMNVSGPKPKEAVLVGLGSMTHSFDMNQRVVQLPVGSVAANANGSYTVIAGGPQDSYTAPPGYYMLFVLDDNRVPSLSKIVRVT